MKRHWFIRCCFMLPILLCIIGWLWSRCYSAEIGYFNGKFHGIVCSTMWGAVYLENSFGTPGWQAHASRTSSTHFWPPSWPGEFLGFGYNSSGDLHGHTSIVVPYWFLILIFSTILFFVWRKTRPPEKGRAFPVEVRKQIN